MKICSSIALLGAGSLLLASALEANPRTFRIVYPERPQDAPKVAYLSAGEGSRKIFLPNKSLSPVMKLAPGAVTITLTPDELGEPAAASPEAPQLKIPEVIRDFYILVSPDRKNPVLPVQMELISVVDGGLDHGGTLWLNRTDHQIAGRLGDTKLLLEPRARALSTQPVAESGHYMAEFEYRMNGKGLLAPITKQGWWHDAESRHLGFVVSTKEGLPKIFFYRDFRIP